MSDDSMNDDLHDDSVEAGVFENVTPRDFEDVDEKDLLPMHPKNTPGGSKTSQLVAKERRAKAINLRLAGASYAEIAKQCGYASAESAGNAVRSEMKNLTREPAIDLKALQYERLNTMLLTLQPGVMSGDPRYIGQAQSVMRDMNALFGIGGENEEVEKSGDNYLVVIDGGESSYIDALKSMVGEAPLPVSQGELQSDVIPATVVDEVQE